MGTSAEWVTRRSSIVRAMTSADASAGRITSPPAKRVLKIEPVPLTWKSGSTATNLMSGRISQRMLTSRSISLTLRSLIIAPLARPVVPVCRA